MLNVIDCSVFFHYGTKSTFNATYKGIPTAGIYQLLSLIADLINTNQDIALCFDSRTNRKLLLPDYKSSRVGDPKVSFQAKLTYEYLKDVFPNVYKAENFEADDLAYTIVQNEYRDAPAGISLITSDYDWCHNIDKYGLVELLPATENVCLVNCDNFSDVLSTDTVRIPNNAITAYKTIFGDDDLSRNKRFYCNAASPEELFNAFKVFVKNKGYSDFDMRRKEVMLEFVTLFSSLFNNEELELFKKRIEVFYPRYCKALSRVKYNSINKNALVDLISITGCKSIARKLKVDFIEDMGSEHERVKKMYLDEHQTNKVRLTMNKMDVTNTFNRGGFHGIS